MLRLLRRFASLPPHELLGMPLLSPTMTTGTLVRWLKKEGDLVKPGQILFEVETDKATLGYEIQEEIYVAKLLVAEGSADLDIGSPLAILVEDQEKIAAFKDYVVQPAAALQAKAEPKAQPNATPEPQAQEPTVHHSDAKIWPSARIILEQNQIDLDTVQTKNKVITKEDAIAAVSKQKSSRQTSEANPGPTAPTTVQPSQPKTTSPSQQIVPRFSVTVDVCLEQTQK